MNWPHPLSRNVLAGGIEAQEPRGQTGLGGKPNARPKRSNKGGLSDPPSRDPGTLLRTDLVALGRPTPSQGSETYDMVVGPLVCPARYTGEAPDQKSDQELNSSATGHRERPARVLLIGTFRMPHAHSFVQCVSVCLCHRLFTKSHDYPQKLTQRLRIMKHIPRRMEPLRCTAPLHGKLVL